MVYWCYFNYLPHFIVSKICVGTLFLDGLPRFAFKTRRAGLRGSWSAAFSGLVPCVHVKNVYFWFPLYLVYYLKLSVSLYFSMSCRQCHHSMDCFFHDLCRSHAHCVREFRYYSAPCVVCKELWERASDFNAMEDATIAFKALDKWIEGFRKNSKNRKKGVSYFYDPKERTAFQDLHAFHNNVEFACQLEVPSQASSQSSVSEFQ